MAKSVIKKVNTELVDQKFENEFWSDPEIQQLSLEWDGHVKRLLDALKEMIELGRILTRVHIKHGNPGLTAYTKGKGISQAWGYEAMRIFTQRDNEFVKQLNITSARYLLPAFESDDVEVYADRIVFQDGPELLLDEACSMSSQEIKKFVAAWRKKKREADRAQGNYERLREVHEKETVEMRGQIEDLETRLHVLTDGGENDTIDLLNKDFYKCARECGKLLAQLREVRKHGDMADEQIRQFYSTLGFLKDITAATPPEVFDEMFEDC